MQSVHVWLQGIHTHVHLCEQMHCTADLWQFFGSSILCLFNYLCNASAWQMLESSRILIRVHRVSSVAATVILIPRPRHRPVAHRHRPRRQSFELLQDEGGGGLGRGRPRGQGGTRADLARRDRFLAAIGLLPEEAPPAPAPIVAVEPSRFGYDIVPRSAAYHGCAAVAPVLGERVAAAFVDLPSSSVDADALALSEYVCGERPVPTLGSGALVTGFGCKPGDYRRFRRKLTRLGSSFVHCFLAMANGILGDFIDIAERGIAEPVCVSLFDMYDETPLKLRTKDDDGDSGAAGVSKVVQSELDIAVLMFVPPEAGSAEGTYVSTVLKMPCPLSVVDRGTGECLKAAIDVNRLHLPNLRALIRKCKYQIDACTADRSNANDRAEDGKYAELPSALRAR